MKFCSACGASLPALPTWPIHCSACSVTHWRNPIPVAVVLVPVGSGVLTIRRAIPPGVGELALPGGFMDWGESWQQSAVREVREETGLHLEEEELRCLRLASSPGRLLVFALARPRQSLPPHHHNDECLGQVIVQGPCELAFPLHTEVLAEYFATR